MSAVVDVQNDAEVTITSDNFGAIAGDAYVQHKFCAKNTGDQDATSVVISISRLSGNDGLDYVLLAPDSGGNPGSYATADLVVGTMVPDAEYWFWVKVTIPLGATPAGNPRQFNILATYSGV